jgi:hypothetical protein
LVSFGVEDLGLLAEEEGGLPDTQAGSHPFQLTNTLTLNQQGATTKGGSNYEVNPVALARDLNVRLPPGLIGNPTPIPRCTLGQFLTVPGGTPGENECSPQTAVGVAMIAYNEPGSKGVILETVPMFNLEPSVGEPARFGFLLPVTPVFIDVSVRTGGDYGVTASVSNISQTAAFLRSEVVFWGVPGDSRHDSARGWGCIEAVRGTVKPQLPCSPSGAQHPTPFLAMPTSCGGVLQASVEGDSWKEPHNVLSFAGEPMPAMDGCNRLPFGPSIKITPDGTQASRPTGLTADVHVSQEGQLNPTGLAESNIKDITVKLPAGVSINPASADGLQACSESLIGFEGFKEINPSSEPGLSTPLFTPRLPGSFGSSEPFEQGVNFCPDSAKIATVKIRTPLLPNPLEGAVYLATPAPNGELGQNPFNSLIAMYIVAEDPVSGSLVKSPGRVSLCGSASETIAGETCETQGQLIATFENTPQLAFEDAELHFFGGERAPLATPSHCGTYTTEATYTPWSGTPPIKSISSFEVLTGPNGTPCPGVMLPFAPELTAGQINNQAGSFSPFTMTMSREDGQQNLKSIQLHMPPGLSGYLTGVKLCGEDEANTGSCGPASEIGETTVSVGLGGDPFTVKGGKVYLTGAYKGAPFGLSIVNPADAGPFHLGKVIVRAKLEVDPHTAAVTVTSDPSGPYAIPPSIDGIPLQIKHVNVTISRPGFTFNPTNCNPLQITGTLNSIEGGTQTLSVPFQATNCAILKFAPKFSVSTSGKTSKANGASLAVKLTYPNAPWGTQANIARVKVDLPKQLPSRLTTLQKACTNAQFGANPAGCPGASIIGHAKAIVPNIPVPLEGPAIFVSHGGEAFPSLIFVLQGYGVTVDVIGTTFISKAGITSTTLKTVPDAPVGSFELTLPEGKYSALAANGNLCKTQNKLKMPTEFIAQNGLAIHQSTKITVTACPHPKHKTVKHAKKGSKHHKK